MAILVTGGAGFIGSHTVVELQNAGYDVVVIDTFIDKEEFVLPMLPPGGSIDDIISVVKDGEVVK